MKKFFLMLVLCLGVGITNARSIGFYVDDGIVLSGNQWHYKNLSIIDAGNQTYLVITPTEYYYSYLPNFDVSAIGYMIGDVVLRYQPYIRNEKLGWLVYTRYGVYFVYLNADFWLSVRIYVAPVYYNYYYNLCGVHYIDMRRWHFAPPPGPRPHHHGPRPHHHHGAPPPHFEHHQGTPPPPKPNGGGHGSGSHRGSGTTVRSTNPPSGSHRGSGTTVRSTNPLSGSHRSSETTVRLTNPPSGSHRTSGTTVRSTNPPSGSHRSSGTMVRSTNPPSGGSRSANYTPSPSRPSSRSSSRSVSRPPSGSRGNSTATRSSGVSDRRR